MKFQIKHWGDRLREGDVLVSNHPQLAGGRCVVGTGYLVDASWSHPDLCRVVHATSLSPVLVRSHLPDITVITPVGAANQRARCSWNVVQSPAVWRGGACGGGLGCPVCVRLQVWNEGAVVFWVASRGHHADIGALSP